MESSRSSSLSSLDRLALSPLILFNMMSAVHKQAYNNRQELASEILAEMLKHHYLDPKHLADMTQEMLWFQSSSLAPCTPFYRATETWKAYKQDQKDSHPQALVKFRFVELATSLAHAWVSPERCFGRRKFRFFSYSNPITPCPYLVWDINSLGNVDELVRFGTIPTLTLSIFRQTKHGPLAPFDSVIPYHHNPPESVPLHLELDNDGRVTRFRMGKCKEGPIGAPSFAIVFVRGRQYSLERTFLVCPSLLNVWPMPVVLHYVQDEEKEFL